MANTAQHVELCGMQRGVEKLKRQWGPFSFHIYINWSVEQEKTEDSNTEKTKTPYFVQKYSAYNLIPIKLYKTHFSSRF